MTKICTIIVNFFRIYILSKLIKIFFGDMANLGNSVVSGNLDVKGRFDANTIYVKGINLNKVIMSDDSSGFNITSTSDMKLKSASDVFIEANVINLKGDVEIMNGDVATSGVLHANNGLTTNGPLVIKTFAITAENGGNFNLSGANGSCIKSDNYIHIKPKNLGRIISYSDIYRCYDDSVTVNPDFQAMHEFYHAGNCNHANSTWRAEYLFCDTLVSHYDIMMGDKIDGELCIHYDGSLKSSNSFTFMDMLENPWFRIDSNGARVGQYMKKVISEETTVPDINLEIANSSDIVTYTTTHATARYIKSHKIKIRHGELPEGAFLTLYRKKKCSGQKRSYHSSRTSKGNYQLVGPMNDSAFSYAFWANNTKLDLIPEIFGYKIPLDRTKINEYYTIDISPYLHCFDESLAFTGGKTKFYQLGTSYTSESGKTRYTKNVHNEFAFRVFIPNGKSGRYVKTPYEFYTMSNLYKFRIYASLESNMVHIGMKNI